LEQARAPVLYVFVRIDWIVLWVCAACLRDGPQNEFKILKILQHRNIIRLWMEFARCRRSHVCMVHYERAVWHDVSTPNNLSNRVGGGGEEPCARVVPLAPGNYTVIPCGL
jgi:hypothetical protein